MWAGRRWAGWVWNGREEQAERGARSPTHDQELKVAI